MTGNVQGRSDDSGARGQGETLGIGDKPTPDSPPTPPIHIVMYGWMSRWTGYVHCHPCCSDVEIEDLLSLPQTYQVLFDGTEKLCGFCFPGNRSQAVAQARPRLLREFYDSRAAGRLAEGSADRAATTNSRPNAKNCRKGTP
jgi:hypothetical protein